MALEKIKIVLTTEKLEIVNKAWQFVEYNSSMTIEQKLLFDLVSKLAKKFKKKLVEKEFVTVDFSIKLEYNEAYILYKTLEKYIDEIDVERFRFEFRIVQDYIYYLHQKLS